MTNTWLGMKSYLTSLFYQLPAVCQVGTVTVPLLVETRAGITVAGNDTCSINLHPALFAIKLPVVN